MGRGAVEIFVQHIECRMQSSNEGVGGGAGGVDISDFRNADSSASDTNVCL